MEERCNCVGESIISGCGEGVLLDVNTSGKDVGTTISPDGKLSCSRGLLPPQLQAPNKKLIRKPIAMVFEFFKFPGLLLLVSLHCQVAG